MKILLVCAGGMSTSLLMRKMDTYWKQQGEELVIRAVGLAEYPNVYKGYDIILVGPQVRYRLEEIQQVTGKPTEAIPSFDYAMANCSNIMKLARKLMAKI